MKTYEIPAVVQSNDVVASTLSGKMGLFEPPAQTTRQPKTGIGFGL